MMSAWMAYAVVITAIAYLGARAAEHLLWAWRAPRRIAWLAALVIGIAAPVVIPAWRAASVQSPVAASSVTATEPARLTVVLSRDVSRVQGIVAARPVRSAAAAATRRWMSIAESALPAIWLIASALLLLFALLAYARLGARSARWQQLNIDGSRVLVSPNCGPAVFGIWRPRIVIPSWALSLDPEARALMLRHEREHLRARDAQCLLIAMFGTLLVPWNGVLWLIVRRLRLAIELDCDDRVLRQHSDARAYGSLLLAVSARRTREMPFAVALAERSSMLERRIRAMTATVPRQRLLISVPLLGAVALLTTAAARTPAPRPPLLHRAATVRPLSLPRLATPESLPPISVNWENAPIEEVIAAFAEFSHRHITTAPGVVGLVTASVVKQPWRQSLERIMASQGLHVEYRADSSIYISHLQRREPRSSASNRPGQLSRAVTGTVDDSVTGTPISNARITIVGVQLLDGPNETSSDDRGRFSMRVPDGEVWLDASAAGYDFRRVTLSPADSIAMFHGRVNGECKQEASTISTPRGFLTMLGGQVASRRPTYVIDGVVVNDSSASPCANEGGRNHTGRLIRDTLLYSHLVGPIQVRIF